MHASVGMERWDSFVSHDCSMQATHHAIWMIIMFVFVSPAAIIGFFFPLCNGAKTAFSNEKNGDSSLEVGGPQKMKKLVCVLALCAVSILSFGFGISASTGMNDSFGNNCYGDKSFAHAGVGWILILLHMAITTVLALSLTSTYSSSLCFGRSSRMSALLLTACEKAKELLDIVMRGSV